MALNQISGRTYQDLMQYPIFPWILADYDSHTLNLADPKSFRRLDRPIAIQHKESEAHYLNNYNVSIFIDRFPSCLTQIYVVSSLVSEPSEIRTSQHR